MILSNTAILTALDEGRLIIDPEPKPRSPADGGECPYNTTSVDLRVSDEVSIPKESPVHVDLTEGSFQAFYAGNFRKVRSTAEQPFILRPLQVALVKTLERIVLPIKDGTPPLAARVEGRSSCARCGLLVHFTAPTIHAGFDGPIVLELCNLSNKGIAIPLGASICQLILEEVSGTPFRNDSQFQKQATPGGRNGKAKSKKPNPKGRRRAN